jgi:hypothetical protein
VLVVAWVLTDQVPVASLCVRCRGLGTVVTEGSAFDQVPPPKWGKKIEAVSQSFELFLFLLANHI